MGEGWRAHAPRQYDWHAAGVPVTLQFYPRTNHITLIGAIAAPLRFLGPVLDDAVEFVKTVPPR